MFSDQFARFSCEATCSSRVPFLILPACLYGFVSCQAFFEFCHANKSMKFSHVLCNETPSFKVLLTNCRDKPNVVCCCYERPVLLRRLEEKETTPCCNKVYICRFCHDKEETHVVNRKEVTELICVLCDTRQPVQATCKNCHCRFGKYTCLECNLFDDEDKNQYHCDGCGICRVGGRDRFFHCAKCNMCLPVQLQNGHTCVENVSHANCPVCLEDIHTSRIPCHIPNCGHLLHRTCFEELLHSGHYACPTCQVSLLDMTDLWKFLDMEVSSTPMPEEYKDYKVDILCKDCHEESTVKFHIVGLKCLNCGSYNTCRVKGSPSPADPDTLD
ncbi:RING finger and CHY zinc finger domain-containing protein 1 isoform X1 [Bombus flavifrons]|uniref:RING finger and CHY zinc finger domain-containing protein 1 isoform X1 n=1 Tax=Bombus flavifrons TaxID=103934 RepID=UPI0037049E29